VIDSRAFEQQQTILLELLRKAAGAPVSYAELQDAGIEFPASVVSELELAGLPVQRSHVNVSGARPLMGVRLDPSRDPSSKPAPLRDPGPAGPAVVRACVARRRAAAWSAVAARRRLRACRSRGFQSAAPRASWSC
jgi:hypothetical protein